MTLQEIIRSERLDERNLMIESLKQCGVSDELIKRALDLVGAWENTEHKEALSHGIDFLWQ